MKFSGTARKCFLPKAAKCVYSSAKVGKSNTMQTMTKTQSWVVAEYCVPSAVIGGRRMIGFICAFEIKNAIDDCLIADCSHGESLIPTASTTCQNSLPGELNNIRVFNYVSSPYRLIEIGNVKIDRCLLFELQIRYTAAARACCGHIISPQIAYAASTDS